MNKHTPGPWTVSKRAKGLAINGPRNQVAIIGFLDDQATADAALIAAAPELYEALRNLLGEYIKGADSGDWGNWDAYQQPEVIAARAALLKATPEQSS